MVETKPFNMRMPVNLKLRLELAASKNGLNLTQEIVERISWSFDKEDHLQEQISSEILTLKKTLLAVVAGTIDFPGDTPKDKVKNLANFINIPSDDPDLVALLEDS